MNKYKYSFHYFYTFREEMVLSLDRKTLKCANRCSKNILIPTFYGQKIEQTLTKSFTIFYTFYPETRS